MSNEFLAEIEVGTPYIPPQILAGDTPAGVTETGRLAAGQNLAQYAVLGRITASGKYTAWAPAASDGSQIASAILLFSCDATAADKGVAVYTAGCFNRDALVWPGGATVAQKVAAFTATMISTKALPGSATVV
jgi:hypothetical protein